MFQFEIVMESVSVVAVYRTAGVPDIVKQMCATALEFVTNEQQELAMWNSSTEGRSDMVTDPTLLYTVLEQQYNRAEVHMWLELGQNYS